MDTTARPHEPATETDPGPGRDRGPQHVLELDDVRASLGRGMSLAHASLSLAPGSFELMDAEDAGQAASFADLCSGLIDPIAGVVRLLGRDWQEAPHDYANALRGRIGRVFAEDAWAPHLTLAESILLQQRHHTRRTEEEMLAEASALAHAFGLPGIPVSRPEEAAPLDRVRAALVRAFLGDPALVLLEHPLQGRYLDLMEPLVNVIGRARRRGAAVLWLTLTPATWAMRNLPTTGRLRLNEARLVRVTHMAAPGGGFR